MKIKLTILLLSLYAVFTPSCKKWLDISSSTEIVSDQHFSDVTGFRDAVIGVYVSMAKPNMYAMEWTWRTVEFLSQQYAVVASAPDLTVPQYAWTGSVLVGKRENMWLAAYNTIANINQILRYQEKNRSAFEKFPITDSLIRGEMLALRAYLHFDLMRLFGKGDWANRPELKNAPSIPYVTEFTRKPTDQRTNAETFALLKKDIEEAISYLQCDPISRQRASSYFTQESSAFPGFISTTTSGTSTPNRKMRMNYWAAKALYARILMWEGSAESKAAALPIALEVMGSTNSGGIGTGPGAYYNWVTSANINGTYWYTSDLGFVDEQIFTLNVEKLLAIQSVNGLGTGVSWFYSGSPNNQYSVVFLTDARRKIVYEDGLVDIDWRSTKSPFPEGSTLTNWSMGKLYNVADMSASYSKRIPLMRITEMYYIAAECYLQPGANYNKQRALDCLNKVRNQRNIPASYNLTASLTDAQIREEITKEYMKEFVGEGQLFFYYKRIGQKNILGYANEMTDAEYQMPMPDSEMTNGGLRSL